MCKLSDNSSWYSRIYGQADGRVRACEMERLILALSMFITLLFLFGSLDDSMDSLTDQE